MYKLAYFRAVNLIGFASGLGKREFELDLREDKKGILYDKDVIVILGDNATGKSTFLSLVHPMNSPSDDRQKFVIPGKEGLLIREYDSDDGTIVRTKCVYTPKKNDEGHIPKCSFQVIKPGDDEPTELNPNGNVSSYNDLLYTYFGINRDFVNFASYSDAVDHIVKLNGTERKNSVSSLIPNTGRFELAYQTVNEKWKEIRNLLRNVSQKILQLKDEETLEKRLETVSEELTEAEHAKEKYLQKLAKAEGRVRELSHGADMKTLVELRKSLQYEYTKGNKELQEIEKELSVLSDRLGVEPDELETKAVKETQNALRKWNRSTSNFEFAMQRLKQLRTEIDRNLRELDEAEAAIFSIETYDVDQLKKDKAQYEKTLAGLQYTHHRELYEDMTYDEISGFSKSLAIMDRMIQSLYDEYGELVSLYFRDRLPNKMQSVEQLNAELVTNTARKDAIYRQLIEKEQYKSLQDTLAKRPLSCKIDTCPFIVEALKWEKISGEIDQLKKEYENIEIIIGDIKNDIADSKKKAQLYQDAVNLKDYVESQRNLLRKYLYIDPDKVYNAIANGTWQQVLDINKLKTIANVLSEKDLYISITTQRLPEIDKALSVATAYGTSRSMLEGQIQRIKSSLELLEDEKSAIEMTSKMNKKMVDHYLKSMEMWEHVQELCKFRREAITTLAKQETDLTKLVDEINTIAGLVEECRRYDVLLHDAEDTIDALTPKKQQLTMDMKTLLSLKLEKDELEQNFTIVEVMKMIIQPGKGINKELINIYMYDIFQLANQLLLDTFDGKLYLKEFIISDKEFIIPFVANSVEIQDISYASSSQQSTISIALSLAIISKLIDKYGVMCIDEADRTLSVENRMIFAAILLKRMKILGIRQTFIISHYQEAYEANTESMGILAFPGAKFNKKQNDYVEV